NYLFCICSESCLLRCRPEVSHAPCRQDQVGIAQANQVDDAGRLHANRDRDGTRQGPFNHRASRSQARLCPEKILPCAAAAKRQTTLRYLQAEQDGAPVSERGEPDLHALLSPAGRAHAPVDSPGSWFVAGLQSRRRLATVRSSSSKRPRNRRLERL